MSYRGANRGFVKLVRKPKASSKLARQVASLNRSRKMQVMRGPRVYRDPNLKEHKYFDTTIGTNAIGNDMLPAFAVTSLNIVPQGITVNSRTGKKLRCMRLQFKGSMEQVQGATAAPTFVRISIVWDREPDKAALVPVAGTDIYLSTDPHSLTNRDNAPRFKILKEMQFCFPGNAVALGAGAQADNSVQQFTEFMDFSKKDLECIWTKADTTGAVAALIKGDLLFVIQASQTKAAGGVQFSTLGCQCRLDFSDASS